MTLEPHPYANAIPAMTDDEYRALVTDIKAHGQREPITRYQGKALDGRHRDRACDELGIKPLYTDFEGSDDEALDFVISMNLKRRHLTTSQMGIAADELATLRQGQSKSASNEASQTEAAKLFNVSRSTIQRASKVRRKGTPALLAAVKVGDVTLGAAVAQIDAADDRNAGAGDVDAEMARRAAINAPLLAPITPAKEQAYTRLIKRQQLYEGACDLSWPEYSAYREAHSECAPLTADDLAYVAQWTSAVSESAVDDDDEIVPPEKIEENVLFFLDRTNEHARVFRKFFKRSAFDRAAVERINAAIDKMTQKWQSIHAMLETTIQSEAKPKAKAKPKATADRKRGHQTGKRR